ncbi:MAG: MFS transporter [Acidimicrobiia bacterium]
MRDTFRRTFRSLRIRNFRIFFVGQFISAVGLWMQQVAELWLILELTDSAAALGAITATHFGPILVFGLWGGVIADRVDKRRLMMVTQTLLGLLAAGLAITSAQGTLGVATLFGFSFAVGMVTALDNPTRRSFVREMVPLIDVPNAVSLNSTLMTSARAIGPAISGILLATHGATLVFTVNAVSYGAVIVALWMMRPGELYRSAPVPRRPGQLVEGLRYSWDNLAVRLPIVMVAWIGTLSFNFSLLITLFADQVFDVGSKGFGVLISMTAIGSLVGALFTASRRRVTERYIAWAAIGFGVVTLITTVAPTYLLMAIVLVPVGLFAIAFLAGAQGLAQESTELHLQGRVMALFAVVFLGSTPVGGLIAGGVAEWLGPRFAFGIGGVTALIVGVWAHRVVTRAQRAASREAVAVGVAGGQ